MIVKMKEILLFALSSSVEDTIQELGELGVVEIREISPATGEQIVHIAENLMRATSAISILENYTNKKIDNKRTNENNSFDPSRIIDRVQRSGNLRKQVQLKLDDLYQQFEWYETWGENLNRKDFWGFY